MWPLVVALATMVAPGQARPLLDVPYVAQTPELCGGAAVSMVLRYWGTRDVVPEDFSTLVDPDRRGIPVNDLAEAVRGRGWQGIVGPAASADAWHQLEQDVLKGRPVIALIEVAEATYHFVVIVGLTTDRIIWHDPARAPFRSSHRDDFDRVWASGDYWSLLVLPGTTGGPTGVPAAAPPAKGLAEREASSSTACEGLVARSVELALAGQAVEAESGLTAATRLCPFDAAGWRELAGLRFVEQRWREAGDLASRAVRLNPDDDHARRLLATSRFVDGDVGGALDAWNPLGEPRVDALTVTGADRMTHPAVIAAAGMRSRQLLTSGRWWRAERRLRDVPAVAGARVSFVPIDGFADVDLAIAERPVVRRGWVAAGVLIGRALISNQVELDVHGALRQGERFSAEGRWRTGRKRLGVSAAVPGAFGLPGVATVSAYEDEQTYRAPGPLLRQDRRRAALDLSDWASGQVRWSAGVALDRFDSRSYAAAAGGVEWRLAADHGALIAAAESWWPIGGATTVSIGRRFSTLAVSTAWRSSVDAHRQALLVSSAFVMASPSAPLAVWPGAGAGKRGAFLRAHKLIVDDLVQGPLLGRRVSASTVEWRQPVWRPGGQPVALALFSDAARAWHPYDGRDSRWYVDAGIGVRLSTGGGIVRADLAKGLRGGDVTWSVGWMSTWPQVY